MNTLDDAGRDGTQNSGGNMPDPVEDLSNVPASVLKQQKEADAKIKAAADAERALETENTPTQVIDLVAPVVDPILPVVAEPVPSAIPDGSQDDSKWEHKYSVLQGKYDSEITATKQKFVDLEAVIARQDKVIEGLNSQQSAPNAASKVEVDDLNPEDFSGWGDEMQTMVTTVNQLKAVIRDQAEIISKGVGNADSPSLSDGLQGRVESLESEVHDSRISSYLKYLDDHVTGDWRALNKDAKFNEWLDQTDPISMQARRSSLTTAADALRGAQVSSIFNLYVQSNSANSGSVIADVLPNVGGSTIENSQHTVAGATTQKDVTNAQNDFVQGRISEADFDAIFNKFQATLRG